jgi:predicted transposase YdaD
MLDVNKCKEILENHFATVTHEEFLANLEEFCPELFEAGSDEMMSDKLQDVELYQQAKKESKLEIAPKLLKKGLSIQEVAEILELDVQLLTK